MRGARADLRVTTKPVRGLDASFYDVVQLPPPPREKTKANTKQLAAAPHYAVAARQTNHRAARSNAVCNNARSSRAKSSPPKTFS